MNEPERYEYHGCRLTVAEIAAAEGLSKDNIRQRLRRTGTPYKQPPRRKPGDILYQGRRLADIATELGLTVDAVLYRFDKYGDPYRRGPCGTVGKAKRHLFCGLRLTAKQIAEVARVIEGTVHNWVARASPGEDLVVFAERVSDAIDRYSSSGSSSSSSPSSSGSSSSPSS